MTFWIGLGIGMPLGASIAMICIVFLKALLFLKSSAYLDETGGANDPLNRRVVIKGEYSS